MRYEVVDLTKHENIQLIPLGDFHIGSPFFLQKLLDKIVKYILSHENIYIVLLGDLIDNAIIDSVGSVYENELNPNEQIEKLMSLLSPVKSRILGAVSGNHEKRTLKKTGIDVIGLLAYTWGLPYDRNILILDVNVGTKARTSKKRTNYVVEIAHGYGGGRTHGGKLNSAVKFAELVANADIVITGHVHENITTDNKVWMVDKHNKKVYEHKQEIITASSLLGWEDYAQERAMRPPSHSIIELFLDGKEKEIQILKRDL